MKNPNETIVSCPLPLLLLKRHLVPTGECVSNEFAEGEIARIVGVLRFVVQNGILSAVRRADEELDKLGQIAQGRRVAAGPPLGATSAKCRQLLSSPDTFLRLDQLYQ